MKRIIVNADDFGINERVTKEIEKAIECGCVSSTTIMANGKCLDEVADFSRKHPEVSFGVHLCLSEFESITKSPVFRKYGLIDQNGIFIRKQIFSIMHFDIELKSAIKEELIAQIRKIKGYNIPLSHCDSHHHAHTIWGLHQLIRDVIKEEGFDKIRLPRNVVTYNLFRHPIESQKQLGVKRYYKSNFVTTDLFCSYAEYVKGKSFLCDGTIELMCHPGHDFFQEEYRWVMDREIFRDKEVRLINYKDI